jgi:cobalt/nickel transport system ATP-binding protein
MLKAIDVSVAYDSTACVVDHVSLEIAPGENVALIGGNGAGKTTLLLALVGVLALSGGDLFLEETRIEKKTISALRAHVGMVFQNPDDQLFMPSIYDDVAFGPRNSGVTEEKTRQLVEEALAGLGIGHLADRSPLKLSGGEKRLAALATVLAMGPEYMLFDEPTAFLDPRARRHLMLLMKTLPQGKLIATHDLSFALETCGRVLLLQNGKIIASGDGNLLRDEALLQSAGL